MSKITVVEFVGPKHNLKKLENAALKLGYTILLTSHLNQNTSMPIRATGFIRLMIGGVKRISIVYRTRRPEGIAEVIVVKKKTEVLVAMHGDNTQWQLYTFHRKDFESFLIDFYQNQSGSSSVTSLILNYINTNNLFPTRTTDFEFVTEFMK